METDIKKFADFQPDKIVAVLEKKGLSFDRRTEVAKADEHDKIYTFLCETSSIDLLVNFDAHHDLHDCDTDGNGPPQDEETGNWLWFLRPKGQFTQSILDGASKNMAIVFFLET